MTNILSLGLGLVLYDYFDPITIGYCITRAFEWNIIILCMPNYVSPTLQYYNGNFSSGS